MTPLRVAKIILFRSAFAEHTLVMLCDELGQGMKARAVRDSRVPRFCEAYGDIPIEDRRGGAAPSDGKPESYSSTGELRRGGWSVV